MDQSMEEVFFECAVEMFIIQSIVSIYRSAYGNKFFWQLGLAFRSGWACLLAGVLLEYGTPVTQQMALPFFSLVICLTSVESSVGAVMRNTMGVIRGTAAAISVCLVVFAILGTKLALAPTIICIFVASFVLAFPDGRNEMARKVALSQAGIIFITAYSGQNKESLFFLVRLMLTTAIGSACAVAAVLTPIPGLACWEARESARTVVRGIFDLFRFAVEAFCTRDRATLASIRLHTKFLAETTSLSIRELTNRQGHASYEVRGFGLLPIFKRMEKGLKGLQLHLLGMTLALASGGISVTPRVMSDILRNPLKRTGTKCNSILELTTHFAKSEALINEERKLLADAQAEFNSLEQTVLMAREETYYKDTAEEQSLDELLVCPNPRAYATSESIRLLLRTMVPTYFFLFNLRMFFLETMNIVDSESKAAKMQHHIATYGFQILKIDEDSRKDVPHLADSSNGPEPEPEPSITLATPEVDPSPIPADPPIHNCHPDCHYQQFHAKRRREKFAWLAKHGWKFDHVHFKRAFKISIVMSTVAIAGIKINKMYAFWANISVGFIIQDRQGGSFRMAILRLQGTVIGAIFGYLALLITHDHSYLILLFLVPWVTVLSYLRFAKAFGPAGVLAGLTAAVVMLGDKGQPVQEFALTRITENFIGVFFLVVVEGVLWPNRAVTLLREELKRSLAELRDCVAAVVAAYRGRYCTSHRLLAVQDIIMLEKQLRLRFSKQEDLQSEALLEPDLWNVPFSAEIYSRLAHTQGRMLDLLYFMVCSLQAATEDCFSEQIEKLATPLQTSLVALEDEVLSSLNLLESILQLKIPCKSNHNIFTDDPALNSDEENQVIDQGPPLCNLQQASRSCPLDPLSRLEGRPRGVDGTPVSVLSTIEAFQTSYEDVISGFIARKRENPSEALLSNSVMLSFSAVSFSLQSLLTETVELEKAIHELLHFENPPSIVRSFTHQIRSNRHRSFS